MIREDEPERLVLVTTQSVRPLVSIFIKTCGYRLSRLNSTPKVA